MREDRSVKISFDFPTLVIDEAYHRKRMRQKLDARNSAAQKSQPALIAPTNPLTARQMNCTVQAGEMESLWALLQKQAKLARW